MSKAEPPAHLQVLTKGEHRILKAVVDRILPDAGELHGLDLAQHIDSALSQVRKEFTEDVKRLLLVFEYGTPFLGFSLKRFTQMSSVEKDRYLSGWETSRLPFKRMGFQALKRLTLAAFYGSEESWPGIGYRGPWLDQGYPHDYKGKGIQHDSRD